MKLSYSKQMKAVIIALTLCLLAISGLRAQTTDNRYSVSGSVRLFVDVRGQAPEEVPPPYLPHIMVEEYSVSWVQVHPV